MRQFTRLEQVMKGDKSEAMQGDIFGLKPRISRSLVPQTKFLKHEAIKIVYFIT